MFAFGISLGVTEFFFLLLNWCPDWTKRSPLSRLMPLEDDTSSSFSGFSVGSHCKRNCITKRPENRQSAGAQSHWKSYESHLSTWRIIPLTVTD